jgi:hypothetical protein
MLIKKIIKKLEKNSWEAKVQDVLRAIQLKHKLTANSQAKPSSGRDRVSDAEKSFWEMIDEIRKEEMGKLDRKSTEATSDGKEHSENA